MSSGVGFYYGYDTSNAAVLEDLLKDQWYDEDVTPEEIANGDVYVRSVIASALPTTLEAMHEYWVPFGGYAPVDITEEDI